MINGNGIPTLPYATSKSSKSCGVTDLMLELHVQLAERMFLVHAVHGTLQRQKERPMKDNLSPYLENKFITHKRILTVIVDSRMAQDVPLMRGYYIPPGATNIPDPPMVFDGRPIQHRV